MQRGTGVRLGYFDQKLSTLNESHSLLDEIRSVRADLSPEAVRQYLAKFRFFGDDPFRMVRSLSGGERSRLSLAKMMLFPRNVLALDEPTNHLDIPAREMLEEALTEYAGTLLVVSHDRYFLDRVCRRLLVFAGGGLESHLGNYSDWRQRREPLPEGENPDACPLLSELPQPPEPPGNGGERARRRQGAGSGTAPAGAPGVDPGAGGGATGRRAARPAGGARERPRRRLEEAARAGRPRALDQRTADPASERVGNSLGRAREIGPSGTLRSAFRAVWTWLPPAESATKSMSWRAYSPWC